MQAQTRRVAKLSKYSSRKPNQRPIDLTALFVTEVEKLSRKEHKNRPDCSHAFPSCALSQFIVGFGAVAYILAPQFLSCMVSLSMLLSSHFSVIMLV